MVSTDFRLGEFIVQPQADRLLAENGSRRMDLEPRTMAVLVELARQSGHVVSSEELVRLVWHNRPMGDNPVYKAISKLRRALADEAIQPRYIETIPRKGYRLLVAPAPVNDRPADRDVESVIPLPEVRRARWTPPKPLARLAATSLLLGTLMYLASAGGLAGHAPVGSRVVPPGPQLLGRQDGTAVPRSSRMPPDARADADPLPASDSPPSATEMLPPYD